MFRNNLLSKRLQILDQSHFFRALKTKNNTRECLINEQAKQFLKAASKHALKNKKFLEVGKGKFLQNQSFKMFKRKISKISMQEKSWSTVGVILVLLVLKSFCSDKILQVLIKELKNNLICSIIRHSTVWLSSFRFAVVVDIFIKILTAGPYFKIKLNNLFCNKLQSKRWIDEILQL